MAGIAGEFFQMMKERERKLYDCKYCNFIIGVRVQRMGPSPYV